MVIQNQSELGEGSTMPIDPHKTPTILQPSTSQPQKIQKPRKPKRKDTMVPQPSGPTKSVADEAIHKELGDRLVKIDVDHQLDEILQAQEQEQEKEELVGERKRNRAGEELIQESTKKQKVEDDKEKAELKQLMETILNEEKVEINAIPLAVKSSRIVD
nr:hypothetical protein [Tanacetum cinerariifolium]